MKRIQNDVSTGQFKKVYLLYGEEAYMRRYYRDLLKNALVTPEDNMNYTYFEGNSINVGQIRDLSQTVPFLADHRVILIENSGLFETGKEDLIEDLPPESDSTVIIFCEEKPDKRSKLFKTVTNCGLAVEFTRADEQALSRWLGQIAGASGKKMDGATAMYLISQAGDDMTLLSLEMEKLIAYCADKDNILIKDVDAVCIHQINGKIFDMIAAIAARRQKEALKLYYDLLALKEPPFRILSLLVRQYNQMLQVKEGRNFGYPNSVIASKTGIKDFVVRKMIDCSAGLSIERIKGYLEACAVADEDIKHGTVNDVMSVELLIISCSTK